MGWLKIDDQITEHPKLVGLSPDAWCLWIHGITYASRNLTDGHIPAVLITRLSPVTDIEPGVRELVAAGLWHEVDQGWQIHDYTDWQRSRSEIEATRSKDAARKAAGRRTQAKQSAERPSDPSPKRVRLESEGSPPGVRSSESEADPESVCQSSSGEPDAELSTDGEVFQQRLEAVADAVVELRFARQTGVRNPKAWRRRCRENLPTDDNGSWWARLEQLVASHQADTPISILAAAADGAPTPTLSHWRTKDPA